MTNSQLYETIFKRKSIRKFDMTPLDAAALSGIKNYAAEIRPLDKEIKYEFVYLVTNDVKNLLPIKAPHYICIYSEKKEGYLTNAGFLLQQMDLYFSANHLGSCWLGMAKVAGDIPDKKNSMEFVIMIAFGKTDEPLYRSDIAEFKRKNLTEITNLTDCKELLEPVRLAPSASNSQPWYISGSKEEIIVSRKSLNIIMAPIYNKMNQVDIGIALYHLWLSLEYHGFTPDLAYEKGNVPKGYDYMATVHVRKTLS
ncbi:nitroreductase [Anaerocolumna sedimenticola]|uniref:Nitroreductase n=1 Tax=Anaerocolumna sedimenticola TaxID=2696063 RepID=A0A6P1TPT8_9FIRM|nr:nitroreductase family protein [Anaerocolumna sedimenticola]QHQ61408.1 nitroreductase [Anaerocolumna sedimenticola]